jgi:phenylacetate-CoA ligase
LRAVAAEQASIDRVLRVSGIRSPALARIAILRADTIKDINDHSPPYWTYTHRGERLVFSSHHLNAATLPHYIGQLKAFAPEVLWVYPTALEALCRLLEDSGQRVPVARVLSSSEVLTSEARALAEQFLGCALMDYYGQAERVAFAYSTGAGEYRFLPGYSHVEFQPAGGKSDATYHEIVGTPLWNEAMPLVRYRTGDLIKVPSTWGPAELLEVAHGVRTFSEVLGRTADALVRPDGGRIVGMNRVPLGVDHIQRLQIIQEQLDVIRVLVLTRPGFGPDDSERLLHNLRARIPREMNIRIEVTDKLERTARGKTPMMIIREQVRAAGPAAGRPFCGTFV